MKFVYRVTIIVLVFTAALLIVEGAQTPTTSATPSQPPADTIDHRERVLARQQDRAHDLMEETYYLAMERAEQLELEQWVAAVTAAEEEERRRQAEAEAARQAQAEQERRANEARQAQRAAQTQPAVVVQPQAGNGRCGGDLPPCNVMMRESRGDIRIWNGGCYAPVGYAGASSPCGVSSASGKWQFVRGTWGGFGGYLNAADAPESVQDQRARQMWAGGSGCSHWSAC